MRNWGHFALSDTERKFNPLQYGTQIIKDWFTHHM